MPSWSRDGRYIYYWYLAAGQRCGSGQERPMGESALRVTEHGRWSSRVAGRKDLCCGTSGEKSCRGVRKALDLTETDYAVRTTAAAALLGTLDIDT